jgi:hypothetical protein
MRRLPRNLRIAFYDSCKLSVPPRKVSTTHSTRAILSQRGRSCGGECSQRSFIVVSADTFAKVLTKPAGVLGLDLDHINSCYSYDFLSWCTTHYSGRVHFLQKVS